jgi:hypothetical protein
MRVRARMVTASSCIACFIVFVSVMCTPFSEGADELYDARRASSPEDTEGAADGSGIPGTDKSGLAQSISGHADQSAEVCGDGRITGTETCDIRIDAKKPGACLPCPDLGTCFAVTAKGNGCHFQCVVTPRSCENGDGCCPPGCDKSSDHDCSNSCGNGIVEQSKNETCEPADALLDAGSPLDGMVCPETCPDPEDPCKVVRSVGSALTCNIVCSSSTITEFISGDGCCPQGGNPAVDGDCGPICGNGIREGKEECDGVTRCGPNCKWALGPAEISCINRVPEYGTECAVCMCTTCTQLVTDCYANSTVESNSVCWAIAECAFKSQCLGEDCYCGATNPMCLYTANGPCKKEIEAASVIPIAALILVQANDTASTLGKALSLGDCFDTNCRDVCY